MASIEEILNGLTPIVSNANNDSFIELMQGISGNPSDLTAPADDPESIYGQIVIMYNEMVAALASGDLVAVAAIASQITTVAAKIGEVTIVAADIVNIDTVAANILAVDTTATNIAAILTVASNMVAMLAVNANEANINAVNANKSNIDTVAGNSLNINTAAGDTLAINDVTSEPVRSAVLDVTTNPLRQAVLDTADNSVNVNTVAGDTLAINDIASEPVRSALLDVTSAPLRQEVLDAGTNAQTAIDKASESTDERLNAQSYADEPFNVPVKVYTNGVGVARVPEEFSALHWKLKADEIVTQGGIAAFNRYGVVEGLEVTKNLIDGTTYDIAPGKYYIADELYEILTPIVGISTGLAINETLLTIGVSAQTSVDSIPYTVKEGAFADSDHVVAVELGALATDGVTGEIGPIGPSSFNSSTVMSRLNVRHKNYEETIFDKDCAKLVKSATALQLDISGGFLNDAEMDSKEVVAASNIGGQLLTNGAGGTFELAAQAPFILNTAQYDNGTGLVAATAGRFMAFDASRSSRTGTVYIVSPQGEYATFSEAINSPTAVTNLLDVKGLDVVNIARIIVKVGDTELHDKSIIDTRRVIHKFKDVEAVTSGMRNLSAFGNGSIIETISTSVTSDGATVLFNYSDPLNSHLTCQFDEQSFLLPNGNIALTVGSEAVPTTNFIYAQLVNGVATATVSTSGWPSAQHCPLAEVTIADATITQSEGAFAYQEWVNHMQDADGHGHLQDINGWIRDQPATHISGVSTATVPIVGGGVAATVNTTLSGGTMRQLHKQTTVPLDLSVDGARIINHPVTPNIKVFNLDTLVDAANADLTGERYCIVVMVVANADSTKMLINMPLGSYSTDDGAINDSSGTAVYTIPAEYKGKTLLAARIALRHRTPADTYEVLNITDLTGVAGAGGSVGGAGGKSSYSDTEFDIYNATDVTKKLVFDASLVTTGTTRTITMADADVDLGRLDTFVNGIHNKYNYVAGTPKDTYDGVSLTTFPAVYDIGYEEIAVDGIDVSPDDYVATSGTEIIFNSPITAGLDVKILGFGTFDVANTYTKAEVDNKTAKTVTPYVYTAAEGQVDFNVTYEVGMEDNIRVHQYGVKLIGNGVDYTAVGGTKITLTTPAKLNDPIDIEYHGTFLIADTYTQSQVDAKDALKEDITANDVKLSLKRDITDSYSATEVDTEITNRSFGFKNHIINGGFDIWQRGTSFTTLTSAPYTADRFYVYSTDNLDTVTRGDFSFEQTDIDGYPKHYLAITKNASSSIQINQKIEDVRSFRGSSVTVSCYVKTTSNLALSVYQNFGSGGSSQVAVMVKQALDVVSTIGSWQKVSYTFTMPNTVATVGTDSYVLFRLESVSSDASVEALAQFQVEEGSVATPFEQRPVGLELSLCQRYYQVLKSDDGQQYVGIGQTYSTILTQYVLPYFARLRDYSSATSNYGGTIKVLKANATSDASSLTITLERDFYQVNAACTGQTAGYAVGLLLNSVGAFIEIDNEL